MTGNKWQCKQFEAESEEFRSCFEVFLSSLSPPFAALPPRRLPPCRPCPCHGPFFLLFTLADQILNSVT